MVNFAKQFLGTNSTVADCVRVLNQYGSQLADIFGTSRVQDNTVLLRSVSLAAGTNQITHTLGRTLTGWQLSRVRSAATVHDTQDSQPLPSTYLTLVASAPVVVDLVVF